MINKTSFVMVLSKHLTVNRSLWINTRLARKIVPFFKTNNFDFHFLNELVANDVPSLPSIGISPDYNTMKCLMAMTLSCVKWARKWYSVVALRFQFFFFAHTKATDHSNRLSFYVTWSLQLARKNQIQIFFFPPFYIEQINGILIICCCFFSYWKFKVCCDNGFVFRCIKNRWYFFMFINAYLEIKKNTLK